MLAGLDAPHQDGHHRSTLPLLPSILPTRSWCVPCQVLAIMAHSSSQQPGLQYLHARGLVHGHLTSHNVMLDGFKVKVGGACQNEIASALGAPVVQPQSLAAYAAPGESASPTAARDVYALGVLVVEMCTAQPPAVPIDPAQVQAACAA